MIANIVTGKDGIPVDTDGNKLSRSNYHPPKDVMDLFARCQVDYSTAYNLQHRPFDEFDGISLLQRANQDQKTFAAYVGAEYVPEHKRWRWRGRKNTARNKLMGILAHMLAGMLFPLVSASNKEDEPDKLTARVMRILVENHLKKAKYESKFLYMVLSALVNPCSWVKVEYLEAWQTIKQRLANGDVKIRKAVDELLTGLFLSVKPIDQILISDFYTSDVQLQPFIVELDRISYDTARKIYGDHKDFKFVEAGKTKLFLNDTEHHTLFSIDDSEGDRTQVQVATFKYRDEDLEATFVGGVFMGNEENPYNTNPFKHRRLSLIEDEWVSIPVYNLAKTGFEPIDPTGRFFYYKSGAFKEFWDDAGQNKMHQLLFDATQLDVFKPSFVTGLVKIDSSVLRPAAVIGMPPGGEVTQYNLGPNLVGAMNTMKKQEEDMSESTQDKLMSGNTQPNVTATQSIQALNQARIVLGPFGVMIAELVKQVGELTVDCIVQYTTVGELDATVPEALKMKYKTVLAKTKEKGKEIVNRVVFTDKLGKKMSQKEQDDYAWKLWEDAGGEGSGQNVYHANPYKFARTKYGITVDADEIINHAAGNKRLQKTVAFQALSHPLVQPLTNWKNVVDDFVIEEYSEGDPDRYKIQGNTDELMSAMMSGGMQGASGGGVPSGAGGPQPAGMPGLPIASR